MSQVSSPEVPSGSGLSVRQAINAVLAALMSGNSGPAEPPNPMAGMSWFDTTLGDLKIRNASNTAWLLLSDMIGAVEYDRLQALSDEQKAQARTNLSAAPAAGAAGGGFQYTYWNPSQTVVLPAGGRWSFWYHRFWNTGALNNISGGIATGGSTVMVLAANEGCHLFARREA